jgi:phosphoribosylformimino-5-aminoimidazole carboxamide ribotide isomerase
MELLPAIDLRHGRVVRLRQGDEARATTYAAEPLATAATFAAAGARRIHVVDLDAALGEAPQRPLVERLVAALAPVGVELGGGLRDRTAIEWALGAGCERLVLGSLPARDPAGFAALTQEFPGRLLPAVEVAAGELRIAGWTVAAEARLEDLCASLRGLPCPAVLVTDVERDGMLGGPNLELACRIARAAGLPALLSGGVRSLADLLAAASRPEIAGAVLGRALYEGQLDLALAIEAVAASPAPAAAAGRWPAEEHR